MDGLVFCAYHTSEFTYKAPLMCRDVTAPLVRGRFLSTSIWRVIRPFWPTHSENRRESIPGWPYWKEPFRWQNVQETEITWKGAMSSAVSMDLIIIKLSI